MEKSRLDTSDLTPWDVVMAVLGEKRDVGIMTLKADLPIIKKIAEGFSAHSIGIMLGVPTKDIFKLSEIWGVTPMVGTLDFSPLFLYREGMSPEELMGEINVVLSIPIARKTAIQVIRNIERYYELLEVINGEENG